MTAEHLISDLKKLKNPQKAKNLSWFFKTGKGEYGEGDIFWGIMVPQLRLLAKEYQDLDFASIKKLILSKIHEQRAVALFILVLKYKNADPAGKKKVVNFYLSNLSGVNNWDLVDLSAPSILGDYLLGHGKSILYKFAKSENLWKRRIAIVSTYAFIKRSRSEDTLEIARILMADKQDLIQKAVGWMLREVGKKRADLLEDFLLKYYKIMPRTMLRYSIERIGGEKRDFYMQK